MRKYRMVKDLSKYDFGKGDVILDLKKGDVIKTLPSHTGKICLYGFYDLQEDQTKGEWVISAWRWIEEDLLEEFGMPVGKEYIMLKDVKDYEFGCGIVTFDLKQGQTLVTLPKRHDTFEIFGMLDDPADGFQPDAGGYQIKVEDWVNKKIVKEI